MSTGLLDKTIDRPIEDSHVLTPVLGEHWQLSYGCVVMCIWFAIVFMLVNHTPLSANHTWLHANTGRWIMQNGAIPTTLVGVPLADGIEAVPSSWLFDCFVFVLGNRLGPEAISAGNAVLTSLALWLWCGLVYRTSKSLRFTFLSAMAITVAWSTGFASLQPRIAGALILSVVLWLLLPSRPLGRMADDETGEEHQKFEAWRWLTIAILFVAWSNIDGSFLFGLGVLLAIATGHAIPAFQANGVRGVVTSQRVRISVWLLQLASLATLLSPSHLRTWQQIATVKLDAFAQGILDGRGLYLPSIVGIGVVALLALSAWGFLRSKRKVSTPDILLMVFALAVTSMSAANFFWFVPVALLVTARHWPSDPLPTQSTTEDRATEHETTENRPLKFAGTLFCGLAVWCGFALSPISAPVLGGKERPQSRLFSADVPLDVGHALNEQRSTVNPGALGWTNTASPLVFAPANWSDWLLWEKPEQLRVFANSKVQAMPRRVQADYQSVSRGASGWDRILDRYAVGTIIVDKQNQRTLASEVMRHSEWQLVHESPTSLTLQRVDRTRSDS